MVGYGMTEVDPERAKKETPKYLFKIVLIGDSGSGKTAVLSKFANDHFPESYITTIGVDFAIKVVQTEGEVVKLQIWDTAGQERFRTITNSYYRGAQGLIIFFDLTDPNSFQNVQRWHQEALQYAAEDAPVMFVGTRADLEEKREVSAEEINELAKEIGLEYFEVSSKTGQNINDVFERMIQKLIQTKKENYEKGAAMSTMLKPLKRKQDGNQGKSKTCVIL